jgi:hypothetical protein
MNSPLGTKNRPWRARVSLLSGESSATIPLGSPVILNTSDLGASVVLPANSGGATCATPLFAGVATKTTLPGNAVEIVAGGYCAQAKYTIRTRAASTDSYSTIAAQAFGMVLTIDTVNNAFAYSAAGAAAQAVPAIVLMQSAASLAGVASAASDASTVSTTLVKVWVRALQ